MDQSALEDVEGALERAGLLTRLHRPPAVCFLDLTGYTRLTEERGDEAAADLAAKLAALVRRYSQEHGGRPVKWLGDGVMFYFQDPGRECAGRPRHGGGRWRPRPFRPLGSDPRRAGDLPGGRLLRPDA